MDLGHEFSIPIIEDCAQSFGTKWRGKQSGTLGKIGCFRFDTTQNLGGFGDSGLVCTDDDTLFDKIKILRVQGRKPQYFHRYMSGNFRIDEIQAAPLNIKLPHIETYIANRRKNAEIDFKELGNLKSVILPKEFERNLHIWNQFTRRVLEGKHDENFPILKANDVGCNIYYPLPLDAHKCFKSFVDPNNLIPKAALASKEVLSLPIYPELTSNQIST
jgi:dTDP-4-amino-4,6-dideoxygalactose transaminase